MPAHRVIRFALPFCAATLFGAIAQAEPASAGTETTPSVTVTGEKPVEPKTSAKVTDPKDPNFVRCRSEPVLNSRAQRVKVCRTNKEWAAAAREGNRQTQELLNAGRPTQPSP